jgi:hypothetical protein
LILASLGVLEAAQSRNDAGGISGGFRRKPLKGLAEALLMQKPSQAFAFPSAAGLKSADSLSKHRAVLQMRIPDDSSGKAPSFHVAALDKLMRPALGVLLAALLTLAPFDAAEAARTGGRVGGRMPSAPPRMTQQRIYQQQRVYPQRSTTNIYVAPSASYGYSPFGFGMSPGSYLGYSLAEAFIREQQRQAYLQQQLAVQQQLGQDQQAIAQLQQALTAQNAKVEALKLQQPGNDGATISDTSNSDSERIRQLQKEVTEQQKEIEAFRAQAK